MIVRRPPSHLLERQNDLPDWPILLEKIVIEQHDVQHLPLAMVITIRREMRKAKTLQILGEHSNSTCWFFTTGNLNLPFVNCAMAATSASCPPLPLSGGLFDDLASLAAGTRCLGSSVQASVR